jgi:tRNA (guanine10-N2)-methyltransferase
MEYLVRLAQCHETFRQPELQAVATLLGIEMEIMAYNEFVCEFQLNNLPFQ